jgi:hypothetical protein
MFLSVLKTEIATPTARSQEIKALDSNNGNRINSSKISNRTPVVKRDDLKNFTILLTF